MFTPAKGAECTLQQAIALQELAAGGEGSGWFREKGHVSHSVGHTEVQITKVKEKKMPDILQRAGWRNIESLHNNNVFAHPDHPGHSIEIGDNRWEHRDQDGNKFVGQGKVKGEAKRLLAIHLNRMIQGRDLAEQDRFKPMVDKQEKQKAARPQAAPKAAPVKDPFRFAPQVKIQIAPPAAGIPKDRLGPAGLKQVHKNLSELDNFHAPVPTSPKEQEMASAKIPIGGVKPVTNGGINGTYVATLDNGVKGVVKPANEENARASRPAGFQMKREVAAFELAKIVGMDDLVATTVARNVSGKVHDELGAPVLNKLTGEHHELSGPASFQEFRPGDIAMRTNKSDRFDGDKNCARAAVFDYITGNSDRHEKNWLVSGPDIHLIDHGFTFPRDESPGVLFWQRGFANHVPPTSKIPQDEVKKYADNIDKITGRLADLGINKSAIRGVETRLKNIQGAENWRQLQMKHI